MSDTETEEKATNNVRSKSKAGFDVYPENINRKGPPDKIFRMREILIQKVQEKKAQHMRAERMAEAIIKKAEQGDVPAFNSVADRIDGKAPHGLGGYDDDGKFKEQSVTIHFISPEEKP